MIDHLVWQVPNLREAMAMFADLSGVEPKFDGEHPVKGFQVAVASLGSAFGYGCYICIDGPLDDPAPGTYGETLKGIERPRMRRFAVQTPDASHVQQVLADRGIVTKIGSNTRRQADGALGEWDYIDFSPAGPRPWGPDMPYFKQWRTSAHPSAETPVGCVLEAFAVQHPDQAEVSDFFRAVKIDVPVVEGASAKILARFRGKKGTFLLPSD